jgi:hypothetical protein
MIKIIITVVFISMLSGCATPYQSSSAGITGGHSSVSVSPTIEKISFHGNGYLDVSKAVDYALLRSAEYANENGKPFFIMYSTLNDAVQDRRTQKPNVSLVGSFPTSFAYVVLLNDSQENALKTQDVIEKLSFLKK